MQIKIISKNKTNKHIFFIFEPDKDWPWYYVSLSVIENQGSRNSNFKIGLLWLLVFIFYFFENFI